jgi:hypothetical protein
MTWFLALIYHLISKKKILETNFHTQVQFWHGTYRVGSKRNSYSKSMDVSVIDVCNWILSTRAKKITDNKNCGNTNEGLNLKEKDVKSKTYNEESHLQPPVQKNVETDILLGSLLLVPSVKEMELNE